MNSDDESSGENSEDLEQESTESVSARERARANYLKYKVYLDSEEVWARIMRLISATRGEFENWNPTPDERRGWLELAKILDGIAYEVSIEKKYRWHAEAYEAAKFALLEFVMKKAMKATGEFEKDEKLLGKKLSKAALLKYEIRRAAGRCCADFIDRKKREVSFSENDAEPVASDAAHDLDLSSENNANTDITVSNRSSDLELPDEGRALRICLELVRARRGKNSGRDARVFYLRWNGYQHAEVSLKLEREGVFVSESNSKVILHRTIGFLKDHARYPEYKSILDKFESSSSA